MVPIHCEGFKSKICASGFDAVFLSINKYILKKEKVPKEENLVNKLKPDAFIGVPDWAAKLGIPTTHVLDGKRPTMGYDGLLYLVKYIKGGV